MPRQPGDAAFVVANFAKATDQFCSYVAAQRLRQCLFAQLRPAVLKKELDPGLAARAGVRRIEIGAPD
jgi:hypothetical protein